MVRDRLEGQNCKIIPSTGQWPPDVAAHNGCGTEIINIQSQLSNEARPERDSL